MTLDRLIQKTLLLSLLIPIQASAGVLQVDIGMVSGHYVAGLELDDGDPAMEIDIDWSADSGLYLGSRCYSRNSHRTAERDTGCLAYLGHFKPFNKSQALSLEYRRYEYFTGLPRDWDTNELVLSFHQGEAVLISLSASDNWLDRDAATLGVHGVFKHSLNESLLVLAEFNAIKFESNPRFSSFENASLGLEWRAERWSSSIKTTFSDSASRRQFRFDVDQPELSWTFKYHLY